MSIPPPARLAVATLLVGLPLASGWAQARATEVDETSLIAVIYPPWRDQATSIAAVAAVGPVLGVGAMPFVVFTKAPDAERYSALKASGAWMIADAAAFRWCAPGTGDKAK